MPFVLGNFSQFMICEELVLCVPIISSWSDLKQTLDFFLYSPSFKYIWARRRLVVDNLGLTVNTSLPYWKKVISTRSLQIQENIDGWDFRYAQDFVSSRLKRWSGCGSSNRRRRSASRSMKSGSY